MPDAVTPHRIDLHAHYLAPGYQDALAAADRPALARACNEYVSRVTTQHPTRFGALALLPMPDIEESVAAVRYALDELHHDGAGVLSSYDGIYLGDPQLDPLLAELDARRAWTFVHPTAVPADNTPGLPIPDFIAEYPFDTTRAILSLIFNGSFEKYPNIRWQFAHGGGTIPMLVPRVEALGAVAGAVGPLIGLPEGSARLDERSVHRALTSSYYDTALIAAPGPLAAIADTAGADQLVFGSDWPFAARLYTEDGDPQPALSRTFTEQQREAIDRTTAARELPGGGRRSSASRGSYPSPAA